MQALEYIQFIPVAVDSNLAGEPDAEDIKKSVVLAAKLDSDTLQPWLYANVFECLSQLRVLGEGRTATYPLCWRRSCDARALW
jgi:hypothetical protein